MTDICLRTMPATAPSLQAAPAGVSTAVSGQLGACNHGEAAQPGEQEAQEVRPWYAVCARVCGKYVPAYEGREQNRHGKPRPCSFCTPSSATGCQ